MKQLCIPDIKYFKIFIWVCVLHLSLFLYGYVQFISSVYKPLPAYINIYLWYA